MFTLAKEAARQGERDGFDFLGCCYGLGQGSERNAEKEKQNMLAAELGHVLRHRSGAVFFTSTKTSRNECTGRELLFPDVRMRSFVRFQLRCIMLIEERCL
jgi:hypothetical protein